MSGPFFFVEHPPSRGGSSTLRKVVRTKAALASAGTRKLTIAVRGARRGGETVGRDSRLPSVDDGRVSQDDVLQQLAQHLSRLQLIPSPETASLPHKAVRTALWAGMVHSTVLFQASLFVSSTWRNTAGLPSSVQWENVSQIVLKMGTIQVVNKNITAATSECLTPFAVAMLASWERQYGDEAEHEVHMRGWRSLPMPSGTLDEENVAGLSSLALETFRESLDERALTTPIGSRVRTYHVLLPLGFWHFHVGRPEARSLLDLVSRLLHHDPIALDSVAHIRRLGLELSAWTPYHTHGVSPHPAVEDTYPADELSALYHTRAVLIQIAGTLLRASVTAHGIPWPWNETEALAAHTRICSSLRTEALLGSKFQEVAVWARFLMCACSHDPERDAFVRGLLVRLNLRTWVGVREMLGRHVFIEALHGAKCRDFFERIMVGGRQA